MKTLKIKSKMTFEEYKDSNYPQIECENFGYEHLKDKALKRFERLNPEVYICDAEAKYNYGLDFIAYLRYMTNDGLMIFTRITFGGTSITSNPFFSLSSLEFLNETEEMKNKIAECIPDINRNEIVYNTDDLYSRTDDSCKWLAKHNITVATSLL